MIEIKNLSKTYSDIKAVKDLTFTVDKGEVLGFLGPNGAGKSTTMKMITGYIMPTSGTITVEGYDIWENDTEVKKRIGYLPENPPLYNDMTVISYLTFAAELKGVQKNNIPEKVNEVMEMLHISDVKDRIIKNLSKGYKQRVGLAQAILGNPSVLILDEPTIGLDPKQIIEIRELIKKLAKDRTIILSTHILPEVSQICDRVVIINKGEIVAVDSTKNLSNRFSVKKRLQVTILGPYTEVMNAISSIDGVLTVKTIGEKEKESIDYEIETNIEVDVRAELFKKMAENNYQIVELKSLELSLEDIFLQLTNKETIAEDEKIQEKTKNVEEKEEAADEKNDGNL